MKGNFLVNPLIYCHHGIWMKNTRICYIPEKTIDQKKQPNSKPVFIQFLNYRIASFCFKFYIRENIY